MPRVPEYPLRLLPRHLVEGLDLFERLLLGLGDVHLAPLERRFELLPQQVRHHRESTPEDASFSALEPI